LRKWYLRFLNRWAILNRWPFSEERNDYSRQRDYSRAEHRIVLQQHSYVCAHAYTCVYLYMHQRGVLSRADAGRMDKCQSHTLWISWWNSGFILKGSHWHIRKSNLQEAMSEERKGEERRRRTRWECGKDGSLCWVGELGQGWREQWGWRSVQGVKVEVLIWERSGVWVCGCVHEGVWTRVCMQV
jgi:hypothetical protein